MQLVQQHSHLTSVEGFLPSECCCVFLQKWRGFLYAPIHWGKNSKCTHNLKMQWEPLVIKTNSLWTEKSEIISLAFCGWFNWSFDETFCLNNQAPNLSLPCAVYHHYHAPQIPQIDFKCLFHEVGCTSFGHKFASKKNFLRKCHRKLFMLVL